MSTAIDWRADDVAVLSVDGSPILRLAFDETAVEWQTHLLHPDGDDLVWESQIHVEVSWQEETALRLDRPESIDVMSPGVTDALSAAWYARTRMYRDDSKQMAEWAAAIRAREYARRDAKTVLAAAYERLARMDRAACQECDRAIEWFDPDEPYECPFCGHPQQRDPIQDAVSDLHPTL